MNIIPGKKYQNTNPQRIVTVASPYAGPGGMILIETEAGEQEYVWKSELEEIPHKIGDRVEVLHNILLGNLTGTVSAIHERPDMPVYEVELDGGGTDCLHGFSLRPLASKSDRVAAETDDDPDSESYEPDFTLDDLEWAEKYPHQT